MKKLHTETFLSKPSYGLNGDFIGGDGCRADRRDFQ